MSYENINFQQMGQELLEEYKTGSGIIRPNPGINQYRLVFPVGLQYFFLEIKKHFLQKTAIYCLDMWKKPCPICQQLDILKNAGFTKQAADSRAQQTFFVVVLDRANPMQPSLLELKKTAFNQVLSLVADPDYGKNLFIPSKGRDIKIEKTGTGMSTKYAVKPAAQDTPLHPDPAMCQAWEQQASQMFSIVQEPDEQRISQFISLLQVPNAQGYPQPPTQPAFGYPQQPNNFYPAQQPQVYQNPVAQQPPMYPPQQVQQPVTQNTNPAQPSPVNPAQAALNRLKTGKTNP